MVWGGTQTITAQNGCLKIVTDTIDANADIGTAIDLAAQVKTFFPGGMLPTGKACSMTVDQTGGTTAVVAISLQGSLDGGTTYRNVVDLTDCEATATSDASGGCAYNNDMLYATLTHARVYCTTVGANNTLTATTWIRIQDHSV
jgi:hypothetical protein